MPVHNVLSSGGRVQTMIPLTLFPENGGPADFGLPANNTQAYIGLVNIPAQITVDSIEHAFTAGGNAANVVRVTIYNEAGSRILINVTDAVGVATGVRSIAVSPAVILPAGNYYVLQGHSTFSTAACVSKVQGVDSTFNSVATEPILSGVITLTAGAAPTSFDPTSAITATDDRIPYFRLTGAAT